MKSTGSIGRADLAKMLSALDTSEREEVADLLGYMFKPRKRQEPGVSLDAGAPASNRHAASKPSIVTNPLAPTPFWRLEKFTAREDATAEQPPPTVMPVWRNRPAQPPENYWLENWRSLGPRLLSALGSEGPSSKCDIARAVEILARAQSLDSLPKEQRALPAQKVQVVLDRSAHLMPYWFDQDAIVAALHQCLGVQAIEIAFARETADVLRLVQAKEGFVSYRLPPPGSAVLALSDLGALAPAERREHSWLRFGRRIRAGGCRAIALTPSPTGLVQVCLRRVWGVMPWGQVHGEPILDRDVRQIKARRLLALLSHAFRIEPGLLRAARLAFGGDAGTEAEVWQQLALKHPAAGTLDPQFARDLQAEFEKEKDTEVKREALSLQRKWRHHVKDEIWFSEILSLPAGTRELLPHKEDLKQARRFFAFARELSRSEGAEGGKMTSWLRSRAEPRATAHAWQVPEFARAFGGFQGPLQFQLEQGCLQILPLGTDGSGVSPHLGVLPNENGVLSHAVIAGPRPDPALFWASRQAPSWATDWGEDEHGVYVEFAVGGVVQRLRWIPPGRFWMGSPEDEAGRYKDEGPRHEVMFDSGYWMMDTPVRQSLWQVVMGKNPSTFSGSDRPVEQVDWSAAQQFISRLNDWIPGLNLALPSEAQWEYACRAGTADATYASGSEELASIAWFSENSGGQTQPVATKACNAWGLYDMLGNVWEWCADHWHDSYKGAPADGSAWLTKKATASRVLRGGSWGSHAGGVRAACRYGIHPGGRIIIAGFRCARVHTSGEQSAIAADRVAARQAERRAAARSAAGGEDALHLTPEKPVGSIKLPSMGRLRIVSDRAELEFAQIGRPHWATHMGCDAHGLFAEFKIGEVVQRLRWVPPGSFLMGSPDTEAGRWEAEGPRHAVTLGTGFWMMDTPVRQSLWLAVMDKNPSRFVSPERPVEGVDYAMIEQFLSRLNDLVTGLDLSLPSEAQWEYACRAGTGTATYAGDLEILGERNAPLLDDVAWYGGNSGAGFELETGEDSSHWREKQYKHSKAGTRPVGLKSANPWGLYDMLGNVWEWCADHWHDSYKGAPADGSAWLTEDATAFRVMRGGSWDYRARDVRAACRNGIHPEGRLNFVGFRCARVQNPAAAGDGR